MSDNADKAKAKEGFFAKTKSFFQGVKAEFKKIVWPTREYLLKQSVIVTIVSVIIGASIAVVDLVVKYGVDLLTK